MASGRNYSGIKFNHLTLLHKVREGGQGVGAIWKALCDCGNEKEVIARRVVHGQVRSCGKCQYSRDLALPGRRLGGELRAAERRLYSRYMDKSVARGVAWELTPEQFRKLIGESCEYCGRNPDRVIHSSKLKYNGVDRVYNTLGYTQGNCVAACSTCRSYKGDSNFQEFLDHCMEVATHTVTRLQRQGSRE